MTSTMRPGQLKPNSFELAILERLASKEPSLRDATGQLDVLSREFTGAGSYTNFACENSSASAPDKQIVLDDVITMPGVPNGLGAVLFCKGDRPKCLEVSTYGDEHWEGVYDGSDERARIIDDPDHSDDEDRFILLGMSANPRLLVVVYAYRDREAKIRIISARKAMPQERALYNEKARS